MKKRVLWSLLVGACMALGGAPAAAQSRSPWQMHPGLEETATNPLGLVSFTCSPSKHGDVCEYQDSTIPPPEHAAWTAAPNEETIGFSKPSAVCLAPGELTCMLYGDFTYFQTFVSVPQDIVVTEFTLSISGLDDGARVTIFNSKYPTGLTVPGSYVFLGGSGTSNLAPYVQSGESNRVVITQVDDCCSTNTLQSATVVLNGEPVDQGCKGPADCDDGNACTADVCNDDGTCSNPVLGCSNGQSCTPEPNQTSQPEEVGAQACPGNLSGPTLVVNGALDMTLECGVDTWVDPGAKAWDVGCKSLYVNTYNSGHDAYGPGPNTCAEGTYSVQYIAWNQAGTTVSAIRSVKVDDRTPPTFKLKGPTQATHQCGSMWVEPGWEAYDACYGDVTPEVKWTGYVNGWVAGTYTVVYTLTDSGGNSAPPLTRTVKVVNCPW